MNPTATSVGNLDLQIEVYSNDEWIAKGNPFKEAITMGCNDGCDTCTDSFDNCTSCAFGYFKKGDSCSTVGPTSISGNAPPFLLLAITIALLLFFWFFFKG